MAKKVTIKSTRTPKTAAMDKVVAAAYPVPAPPMAMVAECPACPSCGSQFDPSSPFESGLPPSERIAVLGVQCGCGWQGRARFWRRQEA